MVVARVDRLPEVEPSPGSASGGEARAAKVAREKPPLRAVTAALRFVWASRAVFQPARRGKYQIGLTPRSSHREFASTDDLTV